MGKNLKTEWNFDLLFDGDDDPEIKKQLTLLEKECGKFASKWKDRSDYLENASILKEVLDEFEKLMNDFSSGGKVGCYFWLKSQKYQNDARIRAAFNQVDALERKISSELNFLSVRLAKVSAEKQEEFLKSDLLGEYKHFLEKIFAESKHVLSEKEERILILKRGVAYDDWVKLTSSLLSKEERVVLDADGKRKKKNFSEILSLSWDKDEKVREVNAKAANEILEKYSDIAEQELNAVLSDKKINDDLREFERPDSARFLADDIDSKVVDAMSKVVVDNFGIAGRFYEFKAKLLGVSKLKYHERNIEFGESVKKYSYEESLGILRNSFLKLDNRFVEILDDFSKNGHIDAFPKKGKNGGAFCLYASKSCPIFIMLNHTDSLADALTLAHEVGHGINDILMQEKQNALNFGTPISTAEVASTFFEDFVLDEILKKSDDETQLKILVGKLDRDIQTIFRQIACFKFEQDLHEQFRKKGYLSKKEIGELFQKHMAGYMGEFVEQSAGSENWWVYWSHIRRYFYNYSYASGMLISKALQKSVKEDPKFIEKVKEFLSRGNSKSPKEIFGDLGIDIEDEKFWVSGVSEVSDLLEEAQDLARKLGKIES